jgi:hypothetical protein
MAVEIVTGRGLYRLAVATPLEDHDANVVLTLAMERADGIERFRVKCRVARVLLSQPPSAEVIVEQLKGWIARDFETTREAALKTIRSERRLYEIEFDQAHRGPF